MRRLLAIIFINFASVLLTYAQAPNKQGDQTSNKVDGIVTVEGKTLKLNYVYAKMTDSRNDKNAQAVDLLFSDRQVNRKDIDSSSKLDDKAKTNGAVLLTLSIDRGKLFAAQVVFNGKTLLGGGFSDELFDFKPDVLNSTIARGAASTKQTVDWFGKKSEFKLSFNAALRKNEWTGSFYTAPATNLASGKASGKLVIDGKVTKLYHVYARASYDLFDEQKNTVELKFTETAVSPEVADGGNRLFDMKMAGNSYVVEIELSQNQDSDQSNDAKVWPLGKLSSALDPIAANFINHLETELVRLDDQSIEGRIYTLKPEESRDRTYELDLSFNAAIKGGASAPVTAKSGKPLPVDGGDPGVAFLKHMKAFEQAKTVEELRQVEKEARRESEAQDRRIEDDPRLDTPEKKKEAMQKLFEVEKGFAAIADLKVTGGFAGSDRATLAFTGTQRGYEVQGRVNMHLENGQWKQGETSVHVGNKLTRAKAPTAAKPPATRVRPAPAAPARRTPLATPNGSVLGTLIINGKPVGLGYVYARRREARLPERSGTIDLFITNKPVPEEILAKVYADKDHGFYLGEDYFKDAPITGIYICVEKGRCCKDKVFYFMTLMTPDGYVSDSADFATFSMQNGTIKARAESKRDGDGTKWSYALNVNANLGKSPSPAAGVRAASTSIRTTTPLPPDEGKASGKLQLKGKAYSLKYAYTWKERIFFDEPDERIYVLITEGPVPPERKIFEDNIEMGLLIGSDKIRGIELIIDASGLPLQSNFLLQNGTLADSTQKTELNGFRIENGRVKGKAEYKGEDGIRTYTVSFDAPLKN